MKAPRGVVVLLAVVLAGAAGCDSSPGSESGETGAEQTDAGTSDGGGDAAEMDVGLEDGGTVDSGPSEDGGGMDAGETGSMDRDTGGAETGVSDAGDTKSGDGGTGDAADGSTGDGGDGGRGCIPGQSVDCDGDPANGCEVTVEAAEKDEELASYLFWEDVDGDGWGSGEPVVYCSKAAGEADVGGTLAGQGGDCDDTDRRAHPGAAEKDSKTECMMDADGDGWGAATPGSGVKAGSDCDDGAKTVHPGASERCNGVDDNCSGTADDGTPEDNDSKTTLGKPCTPPGKKGQCAAGYTWRCEAPMSNTDPSKVQRLSCTHPNPPKPQPEAPGFDGIDQSCDGHDRYLSPKSDKRMHAVWVSRRMSGDGSSPHSPIDDAGKALELAANAKWCQGLTIDGTTIPCDVYVADESVKVRPTELPEGVHVYGGFALGTWAQVNAKSWPKRPGKSRLEVQLAGKSDKLEGFHGRNLKETTVLNRLEVVGSDVTAAGADSVGFWCANCPGLWAETVDFRGGKAGDGEAGKPAPFHDKTYPGETGGGDPVKSCMHRAPKAYRSRFSRVTGIMGQGLKERGKGGPKDGADDLSGFPFVKAKGGAGNPVSAKGADGEHGGHLRSAAKGAGAGKMAVAGGMLRLRDEPAGRGTLNDGGGGGAALGSNRRLWFYGSSGGCPGLGGLPGASGGSSIGLVLIDSQGAHLKDVRAFGGAAGAGGAGGQGGLGAVGGSSFEWVYPRGYRKFTTGAGGAGAGGDGGGGGAGGHSFGCLLAGSAGAGGNFDRNKHCNAGKAGAPGAGGNGGSSRDPKGTDGRSGKAGASGLKCGAYVEKTWSGTVDFRGSCTP